MKILEKVVTYNKGIKMLIIFFQIIISHHVFSQKFFSIRGSISDSITKEKITGAIVFVKELSTGCTSDELGNYSISLPGSIYTIEYRFLGYLPVKKVVDLKNNQILDINFTKSAIEINEIVITDSSFERQRRLITGIQRLNIKSVENLPTLFGEKDILKKIQMLPGIVPVQEGNSAIYVRGSPSDQTLVQLDGVNVFNPSHIYGVISVFNPDVVKDVTIYKGGMPVQYGGKISSLLEINTKDGDYKAFHVSGGIGILSGRLMIEGPIYKDRVSYFIAARRSYSDVILKLLFKNIYENYRFEYSDINSKVSIMNNRNKISFSAYLGNDNFKLIQTNNANLYGNKVFSSKWYHYINDKLSFNLINYYSIYNFTYEVYQSLYSHYLWSSKIAEVSSKITFTYHLNHNNEILYGVNFTGNKLWAPKTQNYTDKGLKDVVNKDYFTKYSYNNSLFISHLVKFEKIRLDFGLRFVTYSLTGSGKIVRYENEDYPTSQNGLDTTTITGFKNIKRYNLLEPRVNLSILFNSDNIIQFNYCKTSQFYQQVSGYTIAEPASIWIFSDSHIKPQIGNQVSLGFNKYFNSPYSFSAEIYYKWMINQVDIKNGENLYDNSYYETRLLNGKASAYGAELMIEKKGNPVNGWIAYSFLNAKRQINGINDNRPYSPPYDIKHTFTIVIDYTINKRTSISANWNYHTGAAVTFPGGIFELEGIRALYYEPDRRNADRMPPYHRLDISVTLNNKHNETRKFKSKWVFSVYNIYGKKNPYYYTFSNASEKQFTGVYNFQGIAPINIQSKMLYIFYIIPSISYDFNF